MRHINLIKKKYIHIIFVLYLICCTLLNNGALVYAAEDPVAEVKNSIVEIYYGITTSDGIFHRIKHASGVLISSQQDKAYILTAYNTVKAGQKGKIKYCKKNNIPVENNSLTDTIQIVTKGDVTAAPAQIVTSSKDKNYCLLETSDGLAEKTPAKLGASNDLVTGDKVYTLGFASDAGEKDAEANRYTEYTAQDVVINEGSIQDKASNQKGVMHLQHSAAVTKGNHGGPIIDEKGYVQGINDVKLNNETNTVFYSVPIDEIREILDNYQVPYVSIDKEYSLETFKKLFSECQGLLASKEYKSKSKESLQQAVEEAEEILKTNNPDENAIRQASENLTNAKAQLQPKMKTTRKIIIVLGVVILIMLILLIRLLLWNRKHRKKKKAEQKEEGLESGNPADQDENKSKGKTEAAKRKHIKEKTREEESKEKPATITPRPSDKPLHKSSGGRIKYGAGFHEETVLLPSYQQKKEQAILFCVSLNQRKIMDKPRYYLGKREDNDFIIPSNTVSRKHAAIIWEKGHYYIQDLNSANGTQVNGIEVKPETRFELQNGSQIMLADEKIIFELIKKPER